MSSKKQIKIIFFTIIVFSLVLFSQDLNQNKFLAENNHQLTRESKKSYCSYLLNHSNKITDDYISENQGKIDILHYDLSFNLYPEAKRFDAVAILKGKVLDKNLKKIPRAPNTI